MDTEVSILRILHILPGVLWAGGAVLSTFVVMPIITRQSPPVRKAVMGPLSKAMSLYMLSVGALTIIVGLALVDRTPGRDFSDLFTNGWGWSIGIGLVTSVVAWVFGLLIGRAGKEIGAIGAQIGDGPPGPEQAARLAILSARLKLLTRSATVLVIIAVGTMAVARWV